MTIGENVLAHYLYNMPATAWRIANSGAKLVVVMDDSGLAVELAKRIPMAVHRAYLPNDSSLHEHYSPAEYLNIVRSNGSAEGVWQQVLNEPQGYPQGTDTRNLIALNRWMTAVALEAVERKMRVVVGNFAVYHPERRAVIGGVFDSFLRVACLKPEYVVIGVHEYFVNFPDQERERVGRLMNWYERASMLGLPRPRIAVTEAGRDVNGHYDGWRSTGWSEQTYFAKLKQQADVYGALGIHMAVFSTGEGAVDAATGQPRWRTYDIQDAQVVCRLAKEYNMNDTVTWQSQFIKPNGAYQVRVRQTPDTTAAILWLIPQDGTFADVASDSTAEWLHVRSALGEGYASRAVVTVSDGTQQLAALTGRQMRNARDAVVAALRDLDTAIATNDLVVKQMGGK